MNSQTNNVRADNAVCAAQSKRVCVALLFCAVLAGVFCTVSHAQLVVFEGTPDAAAASSIESTKDLSAAEATQVGQQLIITKEGSCYIWFSRGKLGLTYSKNGPYHYFINPDGNGYIKIVEIEKGRYSYLEHISSELTPKNYWGTAEKLALGEPDLWTPDDVEIAALIDAYPKVIGKDKEAFRRREKLYWYKPNVFNSAIYHFSTLDELDALQKSHAQDASSDLKRKILF